MFAGAYDGFGLARQYAGCDHVPTISPTETTAVILPNQQRLGYMQSLHRIKRNASCTYHARPVHTELIMESYISRKNHVITRSWQYLLQMCHEWFQLSAMSLRNIRRKIRLWHWHELGFKGSEFVELLTQFFNKLQIDIHNGQHRPATPEHTRGPAAVKGPCNHYRPRSRGDNTFGSVRVCVRPFVSRRSPVWTVWPWFFGMRADLDLG